MTLTEIDPHQVSAPTEPVQPNERVQPSRAVPPRHASRHVRLRTVRSSDAALLRQLAARDKAGREDASPGSQAVGTARDDGVLVQFVVERTDESEAIGLVTAYDPSHPDGHVHVAYACRGDAIEKGIGPEAVLLFIGHLFDNWPFRKVYLEAAEIDFERFSSEGGRYLEVEARLRDHTLRAGRYWDLVIASLTRDRLEQLKQLAGCRSPGPATPDVGAGTVPDVATVATAGPTPDGPDATPARFPGSRPASAPATIVRRRTARVRRRR